MKLLPIVEVWWFDAEANHAWETLGDQQSTPPRVRSVGFLVKHTKGKNGQVILAGSHSGDDINTRMTIPAGMVISIITIMDGGDVVNVYGKG